jgi:hypothetical protein
MRQSFLVLFFKKEHLLLLPAICGFQRSHADAARFAPAARLARDGFLLGQ